MSSDLFDQLRAVAHHYDDVATPVTPDEVRDRSQAAAASRPPSRTPVRLLAAAAALALLAGAVWMFSRPDDRPSTVVPATTAPTSSTPPTTTPPTTTSPTTIDPQQATWFTLRADGYRPGTVSTSPCCIAFPAPGPPTTAVWRVASNGQDGFLLLRRFPVLANEQYVYIDSLFLNQPDGSAWMFDGIGLSDEVRDELAGQVTKQPDGAFVLDAGGANLAPLATGEVNSGELRAQVYQSAQGTATITVGTYRGEFNRFAGGGSVREVTVAGLPGWAAITDTPSGFVVWQMGNDLWGTLEAPGASGQQLGDLIAALTPAVDPAGGITPLLHPEIPDQLRAVATVIQGRDGEPKLAWALDDSLPPQGGDISLAGWSWDDVDGEQTVGGVTWGGLYEVIGTWDGTTFTVTQPPLSATPPTPEPFAFVTPDCDELSFSAEREALQSAGSAVDRLFNVNVNSINGRCGFAIDATVETPEVTAVLAAHTAHIDSVAYLLTPA